VDINDNVVFDKDIDEIEIRYDTTQNKPIDQNTDYCYMPLYYLTEADGKYAGVAVKCIYNGELQFTTECIGFQTSNDVLGRVYKNSELDIELFNSNEIDVLRNLQSYICSSNDENSFNCKKTKQSIINLSKKNIGFDNLRPSEILDYKKDLDTAFKYENSLIADKILKVEEKYKEISYLRESGKLLYLPVFFILTDECHLSTISVLCKQNENNEIEFLNYFNTTYGFDKCKIGDLYSDADLTKIYRNYNIDKKLKNLNNAINNFNKNDVKYEIKDLYYEAGKETKNAMYFIAQSWLMTDIEFENIKDKENAKLLSSQIKSLTPEVLIDKIFKLKENINYICDYNHNIKIERPRKQSKSTDFVVNLDYVDKEDFCIYNN